MKLPVKVKYTEHGSALGIEDADGRVLAAYHDIAYWINHSSGYVSRESMEPMNANDSAILDAMTIDHLIEKIRALTRYGCVGPEGDYGAGMEPDCGDYVDGFELDKLLAQFISPRSK